MGIKGVRPPRAGMGRPKGVPNKSTASAREAIAAFVDGNAGRFQGWMEQIANGIPMLDEMGDQLRTEEGKLRWFVEPNPERAFAMIRDVMEYHLPKLARTEVTGKDGGSQEHNLSVTWKKPDNA